MYCQLTDDGILWFYDENGNKTIKNWNTFLYMKILNCSKVNWLFQFICLIYGNEKLWLVLLIYAYIQIIVCNSAFFNCILLLIHRSYWWKLHSQFPGFAIYWKLLKLIPNDGQKKLIKASRKILQNFKIAILKENKKKVWDFKFCNTFWRIETKTLEQIGCPFL